jgi:hypothetical protein
MVDQNITKLFGFIKDIKNPHSWDSLHCNVLDSSYSMLLGQSLLCNARVIHDWGNNLITIEGNGMV